MDGEQVDISQQEVEKVIKSVLNTVAQHSICNGKCSNFNVMLQS